MFSFSPGSLGTWGQNRGPKPDFTDTGLALFLLSLGVVFASALVGFWKVRSGHAEWIQPFESTTYIYLALASSSLVVADGLVGMARNREWVRDAARVLGWALVFLLVYLGSQLLQWLEITARIHTHKRVELATLGILLALHAVHALAGFVWTLWVWWKLGRVPKAQRTVATPLDRLFRYWRFLSWTWLVLLVSLLWP